MSQVLADQSAQAAVRDVCRRIAPAALPATAFLPPAKRLGARAIVAFCGMVREAIPVARPSSEAGGGCGSSGSVLESTYSLLLSRIEELYEPGYTVAAGGNAQHVLNAVAAAAKRYQVPKEHFLALAQGALDDAKVKRYATWSALEAHCQRVGGSAALALCAVLGLTHSGAAEHVQQLGTAIRLTTLLRSVKSDLAGGRLYLPLEDLARFKVSQKELAEGTATNRFKDLMRFEIARAWDFYRLGCDAICWIAGDGSRLAASLAVVQAASVLSSIERQGYDVLGRNVPPDRAQVNLRLLSAAWRLARRRPGKPLPNLFGSGRWGR
jgi:phytoene synthase